MQLFPPEIGFSVRFGFTHSIQLVFFPLDIAVFTITIDLTYQLLIYL